MKRATDKALGMSHTANGRAAAPPRELVDQLADLARLVPAVHKAQRDALAELDYRLAGLDLRERELRRRVADLESALWVIGLVALVLLARTWRAAPLDGP